MGYRGERNDIPTRTQLMAIPPVMATTGLSKRYGSTTALEDLHPKKHPSSEI
jgi:hypothetical protein